MDRLSVKGVLLAFACATFPTLAGIGLPTAAAQADVSSTYTSDGTLVRDRVPQPAIVPRNLLEIDRTDKPDRMLPGTPAFGPETPQAPIGRGRPREEPRPFFRERRYGVSSCPPLSGTNDR